MTKGGECSTPVLRGAAPVRAAGRRRVARFEVVRELGSGGMGVVLEAWDPQLGRTVALKLMKASSRDAGDRLVREARAMARVSHRNVVAVYDAGEHDGEVWIAMELCARGSLRSWMSQPRPWREVVARFIAAGRGLAAAHEAGLVHRDFKPDNVLLDATGDVRVGDFGVAFWSGASDPRIEIAGTPAYMPPEQLRALDVGPAADQFAFCVSLYEALHGHRPFVAPESLPPTVGLIGEIEEARIQPPDRGAVTPRWLRAVVMRGLAPTPERRWRSMSALVSTLERGVARRRRMLVAATAAVALGGTVLATIAVTGESSEAPCEAPGRRVATVWGPRERVALTGRFSTLGAGAAFEIVASDLDRYAARWTKEWSQACEATFVARSQEPTDLALREGCLGEGLSGLGANVRVLQSATASELRHLTGAPLELPPPESCTDVRRLREAFPRPSDPGLAARIDQIARTVAELGVSARLGRNREVKPRLEGVLGEARALAHAPLLARALYVLGVVEDRLGEYELAERHLFEASKVATAGRVHALTAEGQLALGYLVGTTRGNVKGGLSWLELADAAATAAGRPDLASSAQSYRGMILYQDERTDEALAAHDRAVELAERADLATRVVARSNKAQLLGRLGRAKEGYALIEGLCEEQRRTMPPDHPDVVACLSAGVVMAQREGRIADGIRDMRAVVDATRRIYGPRSLEVAEAESNLAGISIDAADFVGSQRHAEIALSIAREIQGPGGDLISSAVLMLSTALIHQQKLADARTLLEVEIERAVDAGAGPGVDALRVNLSEALAKLGDCPGAILLLEGLLAAPPKGGAYWIATARWNLGACQHQVGRSAQAIATLTTAHGEARANGDVELSCRIRFSRAHALHGVGRRVEAIADARGAVSDLPKESAQLRREIETWLATISTR